MKRIVLFVEGQGEAEAAPILTNRIVGQLDGHDCVFVDWDTFRVGDVSRLSKNNYSNWKRMLQAAAKRRNICGILLLLDGDSPKVAGQPFCPVLVAKELASHAESAGGGTQFSVACVFACQEFEFWFIGAAAGFHSLPDGRKMNLPDTMPEDPEKAPRNAKGWMNDVVSSGYKPTQDQAVFAKALNLPVLRQASMKSFNRMEHAVEELIAAAKSGQHFVSPR